MSCLTRQQQWRRIYRRNRADHHHFVYNEDIESPADGNLSIRVSSEPTLQLVDPQQMARGWKTTTDLRTNNTSTKSLRKEFIKKKIKFDNKVRVILIPTREEYFEVGLGECLWWASTDYSSFKQAAGVEFRAMLSLCNMDAKAAIALMYQSDPKCALNGAVAVTNSSNSKPGESCQKCISTCTPVSQLKHVNSVQVLHDVKFFGNGTDEDINRNEEVSLELEGLNIDNMDCIQTSNFSEKSPINFSEKSPTTTTSETIQNDENVKKSHSLSDIIITPNINTSTKINLRKKNLMSEGKKIIKNLNHNNENDIKSHSNPVLTVNTPYQTTKRRENSSHTTQQMRGHISHSLPIIIT
eukprot:gene4351-8661_t